MEGLGDTALRKQDLFVVPEHGLGVGIGGFGVIDPKMGPLELRLGFWVLGLGFRFRV